MPRHIFFYLLSKSQNVIDCVKMKKCDANDKRKYLFYDRKRSISWWKRPYTRIGFCDTFLDICFSKVSTSWDWTCQLATIFQWLKKDAFLSLIFRHFVPLAVFLRDQNIWSYVLFTYALLCAIHRDPVISLGLSNLHILYKAKTIAMRIFFTTLQLR